MQAKCEFSASYGSKLLVNNKTNEKKDRQKAQKQYMKSLI